MPRIQVKHKTQLCTLPDYLVVDGYFAKHNFVEPLRIEQDCTLFANSEETATFATYIMGNRNSEGDPKNIMAR